MRCLVICLAIFLFLVTDCLADTVILKNRHSINGIITEEDESSIVLNVGCGTITLPRTDIESIERSDEITNALMMENWRKQYLESFPAPTAEDQKFLDDFKELRYKKEQLARNAAKNENIAKGISMHQEDIANFQDKLEEIGKKIKSTDPKSDLVEYNNLVVEFNLLGSRLRETVNALNELQKDKGTINEQGVGYINQFVYFEELFEKRYQDLIASGISHHQKDFYENLKQRLDVLQKDIKHHEIGFMKRKESIVIPVTLNNRLETMMLVDTGSSLTVISEGIAQKLGLDPTRLKQNIELILADGRNIPAKFILLDSVKIGDIEAKNVEAAIIKEKPSREVDGLLGMSFLKNFSFRINPEKQKLLFNYFE